MSLTSTPRAARGRGRGSPFTVGKAPGQGWEETTPPPTYPVATALPTQDSLLQQITFLCHNLGDNCSLLEDSLRQGLNQSQASMFANTLGEGLQSLEQHELVLAGLGLGAVGGDPLVAANSLKARARRLLVSCHAQINSGGGESRGSGNLSSLPKIKLPNFDGQFAHWHNYWELFKSLVDSRTDLVPIVKFNYLLQSLSKEPLDIVKGVLITAENYPVALSLLKERYGNKDKIRQSLFQHFRELKAPKHNLQDLKQFIISVQQLVTQLIGSTPSDDLQECMKSLIIEKLPSQTCDLIAIRYQKCTYTYLELLEGLKFVVDMFEFNSIKSGETTVVKAVADKPSNSNLEGGFKKLCQLCSGGHRVQECPKFTSRNDIRDRVNRLNLCYNCFSSKHRAHACTSKYNCRNCHARHHTLLCTGVGGQEGYQARGRPHEAPNSARSMGGNARVASGSFNNSNVTHSTSVNAASNVKEVTLPNSNVPNSHDQPSTSQSENLHVTVARFNCQNVNDLPSAVMPIAKLKLTYANAHCLSRALIDSGSQKSFISQSLAKKLNLPVVGKVSLNLSTFGNEHMFQEFDIVKAKIQLGKLKLTAKFIVHENASTTIHNPGILEIQKQFNKIGVTMADRNITSEIMHDIDLLIGVDYFAKIILSQRKICGINTFVTHVGVIPYGTLPTWARNVKSNNVSCHRVACTPVITDHFHEQQYWDLESIGIKDERFTVDEQSAVTQITTEMRKTEKGYSVKLPFKHNAVPSTNYRNAIAQVNSLVKKFKHQVGLYEQYQKVIEDYLDRDFIEEVPNDDMSGCYLPHHPVFKESATTPLRIVFNASSKPPNGKSLNDCLYVGPSLTQKLHDALVRFRKDPVAVISDISKAFHRVVVDETHRKFTKFVWVEEGRERKVVYQFKVVIFGACSSPYILQQVLLTHLSDPNLSITNLASNFYVDNFFKTYEEPSVAISEKPIIENILNDASMPLQGWISNNVEFNSRFNVTENRLQHLLGMKWDTDSDTLSLSNSKKFPTCLDSWKPTKRNFVSALASIFDPLGLVGPVTVAAKIFIQNLWKTKYGWDEILNTTDQVQARKLLSDLQNVEVFKFPRYVISNHCSLQVFTDASSRAYGVACYVYNTTSSNLLISKQRVAPCNRKTLTIPKLELTGLLIGCRLIRHLLTLFPFQSINLWSDSKVSLSWIFSSKEIKDIYVSNRVKEIRNLIEIFHINLGYVNTHSNPADLLSRGCQIQQLQSNSLWMHGPSLDKLELFQPVECVVVKEIVFEIPPQPPTVPLLPLDNISSYNKVHNIFSYIVQFTKCKLSPLELIARQEQQLHTPSLFAYVQNQRTKVTPDIVQTATQLNLILDRGVLKCYTRLENSDLDKTTHTPIFIPKRSKLVTLLVLHLHQKYKHCSVNQTLTYYRQFAWTPKLRTAISFLLRRCVICQVLRRAPIRRPPPPPLPKPRVEYQRPFQSVGVDNTGAFKVRGTIEGRRYLTIFVCLATRNIHVEVTTSLSTQDFLLAFRRFSATYGVPSLILSDNGRNFVGAEKCLSTASQDPEFQQHLRSNNIKWRFQTPRSPWKGGHFERMVSLIKSSLVVSLRHKTLNEEQFRTAVVEAQAVVNSRPLTYLSNDAVDEALTPSHLIKGTMSVSLPLTDDEVGWEDEPSRVLRHQHTMLMQSIKTFRKRWVTEYLTSLQSRHYNCCVIDGNHQVKEGDLVLLKHAECARYTWPLARVLEVYPDKKGIVRSVLVRCRGEEYLRSIEHIVQLELHCEDRRGNAAANDDVTHASPSRDREARQREEEEEEPILPNRSFEQSAAAITCDIPASSREEEEEEEDATNHGEEKEEEAASAVSPVPTATAYPEEEETRPATIPTELPVGEASGSSPIMHPPHIPTNPPVLTRTPTRVSRPMRQAALRSRELLKELITHDRV